MEMDAFWPKALAHLTAPYDDGLSEHVVIAEIDNGPHAGYPGFRKISTALVLVAVLDEVLNARGGIGWEVESWGPHPCVDEGRVFETRFWVDGRKGTDEKFQTVLNAWKHHDQEVVLPDSVMLMTYGLVPRYLADGTVCWDDPQGPVYDVIRARSRVDYKEKVKRPLALLTMRRSYLEDYCSLKKCAAVAVYYEERFSTGDADFEAVLNGQEGRQFELPGRLLGIANLKGAYHAAAPQFSRVWGSRLILRPTKRPITDAEDPELVWPGHPGPMTLQRASDEWLYGYVSDAVLTEYESRPEFSVHPESGGVSYGGWWATSYTHRIGRGHIRVELKKLYEGCPPHVIAHWHRFAVAEGVAEHDRTDHGDRNVAVRAKELIHSFLRVTEVLGDLSDRLTAGFAQDEIGTLATEDVEYTGWWTPEVMKSITAVIPLTATQDQFLGRAVALFKLLELLKPAPLRNLLLQLGIPREQIKDFAALKLLATLCQLHLLAVEHGHDLVDDSAPVVALWDATRRLPALKRVFALNALRVLAAHVPGDEKSRKITDAVAAFGVDVGATATGWGYAMDALYDGLIADLNAVADILMSA